MLVGSKQAGARYILSVVNLSFCGTSVTRWWAELIMHERSLCYSGRSL